MNLVGGHRSATFWFVNNAQGTTDGNQPTEGDTTDSEPSEGWRGTAWAAGLALLAGLGLSALTVWLSSAWFDAHHPNVDKATRADQLVGIQAFVGGLLAFVSAMLFAIAHNRDDAKNMDYAGKLCAVALLAFTLVVARSAIDSSIFEVLLSWFFVIDSVLVAVLLTIRFTRGKAKEKASPSRKAG